MYCRQCGNKMVDYDQDVYDAAHRMYREWQRSRKQTEETKLRDIAREVCQEVLLIRNEKRKESKVTLSKTPNRAGLPWTLPEDNILRDELCLFIKATAQDHARTYNAVFARLTKLYMDAAR